MKTETLGPKGWLKEDRRNLRHMTKFVAFDAMVESSNLNVF
jgi:hypothetical protein